MSDLRNKQKGAGNAWRQNLLKFIFQTREPVDQNSEPKIVNRCGFSVSKDFQELLKETKEKKKDKEDSMQRQNQNFDPYDLTVIDAGPVNDTQFANDSFETLEQMCEKTGSDPNSTLFRYLHSDNRDEVLAYAKSTAGSTDSTQELEALDAESAALQRMLKDLNMMEGEDQLENTSPLKGVECTQLEDVEAPSRLWDSTVVGIETSPVKMVGLMRPSTILEDCEEDSMANSDLSSQLSFQSAAVKNDVSATASSCYETANDQSAATSHNYRHQNDYERDDVDDQCIDVDNLFYAALSKAKPVLMKDEQEELLHDFNQTVNLIDLESTFVANNKIQMESTITDFALKQHEESVIEILSDDESAAEEPIMETPQNVKEEKLSLCKPIVDISGLCPYNDNERKSSIRYSNVNNDDKENKEDESLHFNDTLEEMEYVMRKGLEYMTAKATQRPFDTSEQYSDPTTLTKQNTFTLSSPRRVTEKTTNSSMKMKPLFSSNVKNVNSTNKPRIATPKKIITGSYSSALTNSPKTRSSPLKAKPCQNGGLFIDFERAPQMPFFKQPSGIPTLRQKELKQPYAHIVSPIRAYVQKTATAPLMTSLKAKCSNVDVLNATGFREAEDEARRYQPKFGLKSDLANGNSIPGIPATANLLPSKAYISSEIKHVVDERTPVTIPGGQKMQKLLESAVATSVLRHDGKLKVPGGLDGYTASRLPRRRDERSLADLSVMSGDVSLYTIKDAQKF